MPPNSGIFSFFVSSHPRYRVALVVYHPIQIGNAPMWITQATQVEDHISFFPIPLSAQVVQPKNRRH
jgi:hypothetical protein